MNETYYKRHRAQHLAYHKRRRQERLASGDCYTGCGRPALRNSCYCEFHGAKGIRKIREWRAKLRLEVLNAYGGPKCACCAEEHLEFMTIDHIHGGGTKHKQETKSMGTNLYRWLKKNGFPPGFRVLCMNCNHAIGLKGYCPHNPIEMKRSGNLHAR